MVLSEALEGSRWIIIGICVLGVLLAFVTDEGYAFLFPTPASNSSTVEPLEGGTPGATTITSSKKCTNKGDSVVAEGDIIKQQLSDSSGSNTTKSNLSSDTTATTSLESPTPTSATPNGNTVSKLLTLHDVNKMIYATLPGPLKKYADWVGQKFLKLKAVVQLYLTSLRLKRLAKSRRHFFYLMEKEILGLPISETETEIDSYLDCKRFLGSKWPFMWEVSNVKADKIACAGQDCIPMSSYSYLDLLRDESVQKAAIRAAEEYSPGNHGPRMLGGNTSILCELERKIAQFFGRDAALLCVCGYLACFSACAAISNDRAVIFADNRLHASLRAGMRCGQGKTILFKHNDFADCERHIKANRHKYTDAWIVIESVYSMDGDVADLKAAAALGKKYNCKLMMDEAHGLGVVGKTGRGLEEHLGMQGVCTLIVGTFSKSASSIGGYICGPRKLIEYMDFHAPGNVFSAPLPAYCAGAVIKALEIIDKQPEIVNKAQQNSQRLRELLLDPTIWPEGYTDQWKYKVEGDPCTTVIPLVFQDDIDRVMRIASAMKRRGFMLSAVAYPACPLREPRFRVTATAAYTEDIMQSFVKNLVEVCLEERPSSLRELLLK